jgi:hypothetical protein
MKEPIIELGEGTLKTIRSWIRGGIYIDPTHLLMEVLHTQGRAAYLLACQEALAIFRRRLGIRATVRFHLTVFPGFTVSAGPAKRAACDTISSCSAPLLVHPLPETEAL